jgi:NAD(P)-dependent dehydrogenase (short-subunit alcohol dehydrogenase family)
MRKIALVTGGSRGLGRDMAISLAKKNLDVIITYNSNSQEAYYTVQKVQEIGVKAYAIKLNVADVSSLNAFIGNLKLVLKQNFDADNLDFIVNNAGYGMNNSVEQATEAEFDSLLNVHFKGVFFLTQKVLPILNNGGGIVNISSGLTRFSFAGYSVYAAMKGAIETMTKYQAKELGSRQIRANVVAPGAIETDFGGGVVRDNPDLNNHIASITALGRVGLSDDVGSVVAFLCSDDAKWVTGQRIEVSGGTLL